MNASKTNHSRLIKSLIITCFILLPLFVIITHHYKTAFAETAPEVTVQVSVDNLNVRTSSSVESPIVTVVHKYTQFKVLQVNGDWDQITLNSTQTGWVNNHYVEVVHPDAATYIQAKVKGLNVHAEADLSSTIISHIAPGHSYKILSVIGDLLQVQVPEGKGWVTSRLVTEVAPTSGQSETQSVPSKATHAFTVQATGSVTPILQGKTIVLDAGHGGIDGGTTSQIGTPEKELTLGTALKVKQKLENAGAKVIMTREGDDYLTLQERVDDAIQSKADAFISFHYNSSPFPFIKGLTSFYYNSSRDQALATDVLDAVSQSTGLSNRGARFDNLYVLRNNTQPSTLIELGFLSNKNEDQTVETTAYQAEVADGVYQGLLDYFSNQH